ncbi:hypothetical protein QBC33DRAFT_518907 [Phialemonium atrogriseum]|uniref:Uncharacterized protein n=1 Tax=Phialemonium atrogriseum TaxID=1093897 RepID=A0AAJ0FDD2_9PEZI|nr:uncharacterized protein QBC33DRAFT_518907 [Phialemonium atrogriseum]KAK1763107.1 hypothetical protein QBC33DRAFT_518907 [Phialemonium atrogriseum]
MDTEGQPRRFVESDSPDGEFLARATYDPAAPLRSPRHMLPSSTSRVAMAIGKHRILEPFDLADQDHESMRDTLLGILQQDQWSCLAVVRVGFRGADVYEFPVTVLISVKPCAMTTSRAVENVNKAADCIYGFHELRDVAIEVVEAGFSPSHEKYTILELGCAFEDCYSANPAMGASLGLSGSFGSGSLGGYLRLRIRSNAEENATYLALTCHHVLSVCKMGQTLFLSPAQMQPSNKTVLEDGKDMVEDSRHLQHLKVLRDAMQIKPAQAKALSKAEEEAALDRALHEKALAFNTRFGNVYRTSGLGRTAAGSDFLLDWGLVELDAERVKNPDDLSAYNALDFDAIRYCKKVLRPQAKHIQVNAADIQSGTGTLRAEEIQGLIADPDSPKKALVFKIHPSVRMEYEIDGKTKIVVAKMLLAVAPKGTKWWVGRGGIINTFGYDGDSGSPVYDYSGKRLGPTVKDILTTLRGDPGCAGCNLEIDTEWEAPDEP